MHVNARLPPHSGTSLAKWVHPLKETTMQGTTLGSNLTGAAAAPAAVQAMIEAADLLTPVSGVDTTEIDKQKLSYINEAEAIGSVPLPHTLKGIMKSGAAKLKG